MGQRLPAQIHSCVRYDETVPMKTIVSLNGTVYSLTRP